MPGKKRESQRNVITFGKHLTIDAYGCDPKPLNDMGSVFAFLDELPEKIGMHKIITPYVIQCKPNDKKDCGGISGFVMIAESHISIHTFPAKQYLTMDVYSCSMFKEKPVLAIVKRAFGYTDIETHIVKRGLKFPRENLITV